ncbi:MAG: ATP-binding protein [Spirochaetaceae bacterium]|nr:ATP-binding protein [Spirochaetaceae bacterium]
MRSALVLNAVDPSIGGVLIRGQKGTGKTTAVRSLRSVLPSITVVKDCPYHCPPDDPTKMHDECRRRGKNLETEEIPTPLVDLPLNATEDRLVGTLCIEEALAAGKRRFEPGLLAAANRGILYIDEVNLLEDHLVDMLLDAAATGINRVEREGISFSHPAAFMLVGTMNPEEGELRPQFLDRFGMCVSVSSLTDEEERLEILRRRFLFERATDGKERLPPAWEAEDAALARQIVKARGALAGVELDEKVLRLIVQTASRARTAGHRAEIAMMKTALALAAFTESRRVGEFHVREAARLVLPHRMAAGVPETPEGVREKIENLFAPAAADLALRGGAENPPFGEDEIPEEYTEEFGIDPELLAEMQVPGSTAAGSILFSYLKKKLLDGRADPKR